MEIADTSSIKVVSSFEYDEETKARFLLPVQKEDYPHSESDAIVVKACSDAGFLVEDVVSAFHAMKKNSGLELNKEKVMFFRKNTLMRGKAFFGMGLTPGGDKKINFACIEIPLVTVEDKGCGTELWGDMFYRGYWSDFAYFVKNNHPLFVLFLSSKNHPYSKRFVHLPHITFSR